MQTGRLKDQTLFIRHFLNENRLATATIDRSAGLFRGWNEKKGRRAHTWDPVPL